MAQQLSIVTELEGDRLLLRFTGVADMSSIDEVDDYLKGVHEQAATLRVSEVSVDFRTLEFMNSSCFKCFVDWLGRVHELPASERYRVAFDSNRDVHWQRRSLNALRCFAAEIVAVAAR